MSVFFGFCVFFCWGPWAFAESADVVALDASLKVLPPESANDELAFEAPRMVWNTPNKTLKMQEGAVFKMGGFQCEASEMTVLFGEDGTPEKLIAQGGVEFTHGVGVGHADTLQWSVEPGLITLQGHPSLQSKQGTFNGGEIVFSTLRDDIQCTNGCRITFSHPGVE